MGQGDSEEESENRVGPKRSLILKATPARFPRRLRRFLRGASKGRRQIRCSKKNVRGECVEFTVVQTEVKIAKTAGNNNT
ncbi:hypothetical protein ABG768_021925 [Culter alburnus]|uniref:Uncharacterized protein n=1 Tax=Culter alburnus TaxID=194366 RepID=A0AAW2AVR0_CULAL